MKTTKRKPTPKQIEASMQRLIALFPGATVGVVKVEAKAQK